MKIVVEVDILKTTEGDVPKKNSVESIAELLKRHDVYIKGDNKWVKRYFKDCEKELRDEHVIITSKNQKNTKERKVILFGSERYPNWESIINVFQ